MKHIKSIVSAALALAMTLGMAVPAMAADGFDTYTLQDYQGVDWTFSSAKVDTGSVTLDWYGGTNPQVEENVTIITVAPGSTITYAGGDARMTGYTTVDGAYLPLDGTYVEFQDSAVTDRLFGNNENWSMPVNMLSIYTSMDLKNGVSERAYILPADAYATETPAEPEEPAAESAFTDVPANAYYSDAVTWAVEQGITGGTSATTFSPNADCTRAQVITFLYRAAGSPDISDYENPFTDVSTDDYYYAAAIWAAANGIAGGTSATTFAPGATCSRGQVVTFLYRAAGSPTTQLTDDFGDVSATDYYASAVAWAAANSITGGTGNNTFSPNNACTRGQVVTFLYRTNAD